MTDDRDELERDPADEIYRARNLEKIREARAVLQRARDDTLKQQQKRKVDQ